MCRMWWRFDMNVQNVIYVKSPKNVWHVSRLKNVWPVTQLKNVKISWHFEFDQWLTQLLITGTGKNSMIRICWQQHRTASQGLPCSRRQWAWGSTQRWRWGWPPPAPSPTPSPLPAPSRGTGDHQQINHMWSSGDIFRAGHDWTTTVVEPQADSNTD